jgi:hypothetical protein
VENGQKTKTTFITLSAFSTQQRVFKFYFPSIGVFRQFPITVSKRGAIMGAGHGLPKLVVRMPPAVTEVDAESWDDVSLNGSESAVLRLLKARNCHSLDLSRIYWRFSGNASFWRTCVEELIDKGGLYDRVIAGYSLQSSIVSSKHFNGRVDLQRCYLLSDARFRALLKPVFDDAWLRFDDVADNAYAHLEYIPLVNSRAHLLGAKREIVNDGLRAQYGKFVERVLHSCAGTFDMRAADRIAGCYYLLAQDRIEEALDCYKLVVAATKRDGGGAVDEDWQFSLDYLRAYMSMFADGDDDSVDTQAIVESVAAKWRGVDLPKSKRKLIEDIEVLLSDLRKDTASTDGDDGDYVREADGAEEHVHGLGDRDRAVGSAASKSPVLDFDVDRAKRCVMLATANLVGERVRVDFYSMNTEVLFSMNPFSFSKKDSADGESNAFGLISANESVECLIESDSQACEIPARLANADLFIRVVAPTMTRSQTFYDTSLRVQLAERFGALTVVDAGARRSAVKKAYVKVFAKMRGGGGHEFFKDGYTDIRGKFDYASISTDQLERTEEFAILVADEKRGCVVKTAKPPKQ